MPSWDLFEHQSDEYKAKVLPPEVKARVAVEQAVDIRLVAVCWPNRHSDRDAPIRCFGADQGFAEEVRVHHGERGRGGPKSTGEMKQSSVVVLSRQKPGRGSPDD